jgi:hypothetical protein
VVVNTCYVYIVKWRMFFFTDFSGFICMGNLPIHYATSEVITYFLIIVTQIAYNFNICIIFQWEHCSLCFSPFMVLFCWIFVVFLFIVLTLYGFGYVISSYLSIAMFCLQLWLWYLIWTHCTTLSCLVFIYLWFI